MPDTEMRLSPDEREELIRRLLALRGLAEELIHAFDSPEAARGAAEMLSSIDRMLELVGGAEAPQ